MRRFFLLFPFLFLMACTKESPVPNPNPIAPIPEKDLVDSALPPSIQKFLDAYPNSLEGATPDSLFFKNGKRLLFDDGILQKSRDSLLNFPDVQDMLHDTYLVGELNRKPLKSEDAGRIRNEAFFKAMYGSSKEEVQAHLTEITWCPKLVNQKFLVTTINGVDEKIRAISKELDEHPEWAKYLQNIGGTFNWRTISGTDRLSAHSFGMTIDINIKYSNYWQWDAKTKEENVELDYKNQIPWGIVRIFEKHGFVWGGKWYHYDTMHFEYRPELLP